MFRISTRRVPLFFMVSSSSLGVNWLQPVPARRIRQRVSELSSFIQVRINLFWPDPVIILSSESPLINGPCPDIEITLQATWVRANYHTWVFPQQSKIRTFSSFAKPVPSCFFNGHLLLQIEGNSDNASFEICQDLSRSKRSVVTSLGIACINIIFLNVYAYKQRKYLHSSQVYESIPLITPGRQTAPHSTSFQPETKDFRLELSVFSIQL